MLKAIQIITAVGLLMTSVWARAEIEPDDLARNTTNEVIRIVSARKATPNERKQYGSYL